MGSLVQGLGRGREGSDCVKAVGSSLQSTCKIWMACRQVWGLVFFSICICCFSFCQYFSIVTFIALKNTGYLR